MWIGFMLRILHVYKDYHPVLGGIENHIKTLAQAQAAMGHEVTVLVTNPGREVGRDFMNGVAVIRAWRLATVASTPLSPIFPLLLRRQRPDITHLHFPYPVGEVSQWLLGRKRPTVVTYHSDVVKQQSMLRLYNPLLKRVLGSVDKIIVGSDNYIESSPYLRPLSGKCVQIPFSVDATRFQNVAPLFPPNQMPTLLFIGRHRYYKGVDDLIRALPDVHARLFIGGDGPMRPSWESLVEEMNLADRVQFVGNVSDEDLPGFYASGDIFVLPANSRAEAFGKVL
jgi:glycosyltransferase involved in cell wall biosynthesis